MNSAVLDLPPIDPAKLDEALATGKMIRAAAGIPAAAEVVDTATVINDKPIVKYSRTEAALADLRARFKDAKFDLTTTKGDEAARAARLALVTLRTDLEKKRKAFKAPALEFGKMIDAEAKRITDEIAALEAPIDAQIKDDEARREAERAEKARIEAERVAMHNENIGRIRAYLRAAQQPGMTSLRIAAGMKMLGEVTIDASFEEFEGPALAAQVETLKAMRVLHDDALAREMEAQRVEAQRIENERVARELAEQRRQLDEMAAKAARQLAEAARIKEFTGHEPHELVDLAGPDRVVTVQLGAGETPAAGRGEAPPSGDEEPAAHADDSAAGSVLIVGGSLAPPVFNDSGAFGVVTADATHPGFVSVYRSTPVETEAAATVYEALAMVEADGALLRQALALVDHANNAFVTRFPSHPKPDQAWWAELREMVNTLQPALLLRLAEKRQ